MWPFPDRGRRRTVGAVGAPIRSSERRRRHRACRPTRSPHPIAFRRPKARFRVNHVGRQARWHHPRANDRRDAPASPTRSRSQRRTPAARVLRRDRRTVGAVGAPIRSSERRRRHRACRPTRSPRPIAFRRPKARFRVNHVGRQARRNHPRSNDHRDAPASPAPIPITESKTTSASRGGGRRRRPAARRSRGQGQSDARPGRRRALMPQRETRRGDRVPRPRREAKQDARTIQERPSPCGHRQNAPLKTTARRATGAAAAAVAPWLRRRPRRPTRVPRIARAVRPSKRGPLVSRTPRALRPENPAGPSSFTPRGPFVFRLSTRRHRLYTCSLTHPVVTDFGLSSGRLSARSQRSDAIVPVARETPNNTVKKSSSVIP